jgi:hypothetical protein
MPTLTLGRRRPAVKLPDVDRPSITMPEVDLSKLNLSKLDLPKVDLAKLDMPDLDKPKADLAKAIAGAAVAVGVAQPKRSRWPLVLGAGIAVAVGAWSLMNLDAIRERLSRWGATIQERVSEMTAGSHYQDPVAFPAAEPKPIEDEPNVGDFMPADDGYPKGFGLPNEMEPATPR